ncbi:MAG: sigma-70 family RNA polymerase sigma factor [Deltaproteobacteria bacterium]|nr:sigma-70 family RNA polymerase sigma factor [Deltaproteobacteria bacterium]MBN2674250.1 sigma-70 family RNA polymerase sigma factor [Deltaproteobacteria bacterium]
MNINGTQRVNKSTNVSPFPVQQDYSPYELVNGLTRGDQKISAAFFDQYNGQINRLVRHFLGPDEEHVDIVNTAFTQILQSISKLKDPQALTRWVSTVTIHVVRGEIRKRKTRRLFHVFTDATEPYGTSTNATQDVLSRIYRTIRSLNTNEQVVFILHYVEGFTFEQVAEFEQISIATAKRRGQKGKDTFIQKLQGDLELSRFLEEITNG